jgi:hypothetical protein
MIHTNDPPDFLVLINHGLAHPREMITAPYLMITVDTKISEDEPDLH